MSSLNAWVDDRIKAAVEAAIPLLAAQEGPLVQALVSALTKALVDALVGAVAAQIGTLALTLPGATAHLLTNEINQIPQQVNELLDVPAAVAGAMTNLPEQIAHAIRDIFPFHL